MASILQPDADSELVSLRRRLLEHRLYDSLQSAAAIGVFMRHHVFCVWDFQSLLKGLQRHLTCVTVPWLPTVDPVSRRLLNEIVLDEESDEDGRGGYLSHFELYLEAMRDAEADTRLITRFLAALRTDQPVEQALQSASVPPATAAHVRLSLTLARSADLHRLAAAFALGREDLIPAMFVRFLQHLATSDAARFGRFASYLQRHVGLDAEQHGPQSRRLLERVCDEDAIRQGEALEVARACLQARLAVWDEILVALRLAGE
jgi:Protein of unknown function (DUF3050)